MREGEGGGGDTYPPPLLPTPKALAPNGSGLDPRSSRAFAREKEGEARDGEKGTEFPFSSVAELCGSCTF